MSDAQWLSHLRAGLGVDVAALEQTDGCAVLSLPARFLAPACELLRDEEGARFDLLLAIVSAGDRVCYQLASTSRRARLRLELPSPAPLPGLDSVAFVWPAANWLEREARDLWALEFAAHPDPRPLLRGAPAGEAQWLSGSRFPASVGGLRVELSVEDDCVVAARPVLGHRHVGLGAFLARWPYARGTYLAARLDGSAAMAYDLAYAIAVERLLGLDVPPRARFLRTIYAELQRIASHLGASQRTLNDFLEPEVAAPAYAAQGREAILDLFQWLGGNPITPDVISVGGLRRDAPDGFGRVVGGLLDDVQALLGDLEQLSACIPAMEIGLSGLGVIDPGTALGLAVTGPCLRACGVAYDVRSAFPYAAYDELPPEVPVGQDGDALARHRLRVFEMAASVDLVRRALAALPSGPISALPESDLPPEVPAGTAYAGVESARGEVSVFAVSDGGGRLATAHVRGPSMAALSALPLLARGTPVERFGALVHSLDVSPGEAER